MNSSEFSDMSSLLCEDDKDVEDGDFLERLMLLLIGDKATSPLIPPSS
jgi:hypothetical protein